MLLWCVSGEVKLGRGRKPHLRPRHSLLAPPHRPASQGTLSQAEMQYEQQKSRSASKILGVLASLMMHTAGSLFVTILCVPHGGPSCGDISALLGCKTHNKSNEKQADVIDTYL